MSDIPFKWFFNWEGGVTRRQYFLAGIFLVLLKFAIDWSVATAFHQTWHIWNYFLPFRINNPPTYSPQLPQFYGVLWAIAIPFFWIGISLTLRRLRDAGQNLGFVFLFFVPLMNLGLFLTLSLLPTAPQPAASPEPSLLRASDQIRAIIGVLSATALGVLLVFYGANILAHYAWGLFLGIPFVTGFIASWFLNSTNTQSKSRTTLACAATTFVIGACLIGFRIEGVVCLAMALPLSLPFSIAGGLVARSILKSRYPKIAPGGMSACVAILPLLMLAEHHANIEPPINAVTTSIVINAPVSAVWKNVIAFPPLAPPQELMFRAGIAYPTSAKIIGSGPGAIRYCQFSTGDFVEPITVWDENHLLAFNVTSEPPSLRELSPWKINPPHIDRNYMRSRHGQFRLVALDDHHTLLEGTTWYQNYFWPQPYWQHWSDTIVHRIHSRVLQHVKTQAEAVNPS